MFENINTASECICIFSLCFLRNIWGAWNLQTGEIEPLAIRSTNRSHLLGTRTYWIHIVINKTLFVSHLSWCSSNCGFCLTTRKVWCSLFPIHTFCDREIGNTQYTNEVQGKGDTSTIRNSGDAKTPLIKLCIGGVLFAPTLHEFIFLHVRFWGLFNYEGTWGHDYFPIRAISKIAQKSMIQIRTAWGSMYLQYWTIWKP